MSDTMFALADTRTVGAFLLAGAVRRRIGTAQIWRDVAGHTWLGVAERETWVGVAGAGPGVIFHPAAPAEAVSELGIRPRMSKAPQRVEFEVALDQLRLGSRITRLLWAVHIGVIDQRVSAPEYGYADLAARVWGRNPAEWPHHWRRDLRELLRSLTWLHRAEAVTTDKPAFGTDTVLVYQVEINGEQLTDSTGRDARDARIRIFAGPALVGCLEQLAKVESSGVNTYDAIQSLKSLREVGRRGQLQRVFLPALLPEPTGLELTPSQQRLVQALVRETTRARKKGRKSTQGAAEPEVVTGSVVRAYSGRGVVSCRDLRGDVGHVGFNGNGRRGGMGYRPTSRGWLARCGYAANEAKSFLADLHSLADNLGMLVVGVARDVVVGIDTLTAWASAGATAGRLAMTDVRVFVPQGYEMRCATCFGWSVTPVAERADSDQQRLVELVARTGQSQRDVARRLGINHSFLGRILAGKKTCPAGLVERVEALIAREVQVRSRTGGVVRGRPRHHR